MKNYILSLFVIIILSACTATHITSSWREPDKTITISNLNKVLVVALFKTESSRHKAEDEMVTYLNGRGIVSSNYLNAVFNTKNEEAIREKIKSDGFDGAITMRLIDMEKETIHLPGNSNAYPPYYSSFSGYYFRNFSFYNNLNYYSTTKKYTVETNIFSIKEDKIIWTGTTETTDPGGVDKMIKEIAKVLYKKMKQEGFIIR